MCWRRIWQMYPGLNATFVPGFFCLEPPSVTVRSVICWSSDGWRSQTPLLRHPFLRLVCPLWSFLQAAHVGFMTNYRCSRVRDAEPGRQVWKRREEGDGGCHSPLTAGEPGPKWVPWAPWERDHQAKVSALRRPGCLLRPLVCSLSAQLTRLVTR